MKYLLDTHIFLWFLNGNVRLSQKAKKEIENPKNNIFISVASFWEIAIKMSLNKLTLDTNFQGIVDAVGQNGFLFYQF